ncbi:MAG TPA: hypothetical protein VK138_16575 [Acidiferrobacterales bacterium]|nr:hypothetical protein [Acidiferrobacterales bacterium]
MFKKTIFASSLLCLSMTLLAASPLSKLLTEAESAYEKKDYQAAIGKLTEAQEQIRNEAPLELANVILVAQKAQGMGQGIKPRPNNRYRAGQEILVYLEPQNYGIRSQSGGYHAQLVLDLLVKEPAGKQLFEQKAFGRFPVDTARLVRDLYLNVTVTLTGAPAGKYLLEVVAHDVVGDKSANVTIPVEII